MARDIRNQFIIDDIFNIFKKKQMKKQKKESKNEEIQYCLEKVDRIIIDLVD